MRRVRLLAWIVLGLLLIVGVEVTVLFPPDEVCRDQGGEGAEKQQCGPAIISSLFFGEVHAGRRLAGFTERHNGAVSAVSTIFIAIFTVVLAVVTRRQAILTGIVASAARDSANFLAQTERAVVFDMYIDDSVRSEEDRFRSAVQPTAHGVTPAPFGSLRLRATYRLKNYGKMPAFLGDIEDNIIIAAELPEEPDYRPKMHVLQERVLSADGEGITQDLTCQRTFERALGGVAHDVFAIRTQEIWFFARVRYRDISAGGREHAFVYCYDRQRRRFIPIEHSRYTKDT